MRKLMLIFNLFLLAGNLFAQENIDDILARNPFDENRGKLEEGEAEAEVVEEVIPGDMPVLDGTIMAGEFRIAMFTIKEDGQPKALTGKINDNVAGYKINEIKRNLVMLSKPGSDPIPLQMYSEGNKKESRGGTKAKPKPKPKPRPANNALKKEKEGNNKAEELKRKRAERLKNNKKKQFDKRNPPKKSGNRSAPDF